MEISQVNKVSSLTNHPYLSIRQQEDSHTVGYDKKTVWELSEKEQIFSIYLILGTT
jgi:hypothetical protein